jgi:hypothetical protein
MKLQSLGRRVDVKNIFYYLFAPIKDGDDVTRHVIGGLCAMIGICLLIFVVAIFLNFLNSPRPVLRLSGTDIEHIRQVLLSKEAPDCVVEPTEYGWKCTRPDGLHYKIRRVAQ